VPRSFLLLLTLLVVSWATPASAQDNSALAGFSETEKVGFAFYHLINRPPPYDSWIVARDDYKIAKPQTRLSIMDLQRQRLREGFDGYFIDQDVITLNLKVRVQGKDNPDYAKDPALQDAGLTKMIDIKFSQTEDMPYFPFPVGELWVGVIPEHIEKLSRHYLSPEQYQRFCSGTGACIGGYRPVDVQLVLRPKKADAKEPVVVRNVPVWLMLSDVASIAFLARDGNMLWEYTAPWYDRQRASELMTLFAK
jgi:hypothetical protein